jgi:outer membrane protease
MKQNNNNKKLKNYKYGIFILTFKDGSKKYRVKRCGKHLGYFETHEEAMLVSLAYDKQLEEEGIKPKAR